MKKIIVSSFVCLMIMMTSAFAFTDVTESHWAYDKITFMADNGVIKGFEDGTFKPDEQATREQSATILNNFFGFVLKDKIKTFEDVEETAWSKKAIDLASQYLYDDGADLFRPTEKTLRIEVAEAILRYLGIENDEADLTLLDAFSDKDNFSEEDAKIIALITENKIMSGDGVNFRPNANITRAEICTLLYNAFKDKNELLSKNDNKAVLNINGEDVTVKEFKLYLGLQRKIYELISGRNDLWYEETDGINLYNLCKDLTKEEMINTVVNLQKAEELGIKLDDITETALKSEIESENTQSICSYYNITVDELTQINRESAIINLLAKNVYEKIDHSTHTHADISELKDELTYSVRHILIMAKDGTEEAKTEAQKLAQDILERAKNGEDFATLAEQYSEDFGSNTNGGLYENVKQGQFVSELEDAVLSIEAGEIYPELVESFYGYHIIKSEGKKTEKVEMTEEEKNEIINSDFKEESAKWVEAADVKLYEEVYKRI